MIRRASVPIAVAALSVLGAAVCVAGAWLMNLHRAT